MNPDASANSVLRAVRGGRLLAAGDRVVVAVSGGPDSLALLEALAELRDELDLWLAVAHLNHKLRGGESDADAALVAARAAALGLPACIGAADVRAERRARGGSLEMAARRARYTFLEQVAAELDAAKVALGHTADDQAETILQRLLRGGELDALRGMPAARLLSPSSRATLVRPLLGVWRAEVLDYLAARGVAWRADASNADLSFQRNWIRHRLLPLLEARCAGKGPGTVSGEAPGPFSARAALLGLAARAGELGEVIAVEAQRLVAKGEGSARLDAAAMAAVPRLVRRAAARMAYAAAGGRGELTWRALDAVEGLLAGGSGRSVALAGGLVAQRAYGEVVVRRRAPPRPAVRAALAVPGRVELPEVGLWVEASVEARVVKPRRVPVFRSGPPWQEVVDLDAVGETLEVRTRRAGDRFVPLGLGAAVKLKDFFINERVPREARDATLLVVGRAGIAWVVGLRLDDRAKVTSATRRVARLRAGPLDRP